ncbi:MULTISPECIES: SNF2 helicase-associated domain-containing protein, partial [Cupriavidus]
MSGVTRATAPSDFLGALARIEASDLPDYQPEVAAFYQLRLVTLHLLSKGAVTPQIYAHTNNVAGVRWLPAIADEQVKGVVHAVALPPRLLTVDGQSRPRKTVERYAGALHLCSVWLTHYVRTWAGSPNGDMILGLFFTDNYAHFDRPGEGAIPGAIQTSLSAFHLAERRFSPVLRVDDIGAGFTVDIDVQDREHPTREPTALATVIADNQWGKHRYAVLQTISVLDQHCPPINDYVQREARTPIAVSSAQLPSWLNDTLPVLRLMGIRSLLPKGMEALLRPKLSMRIAGQPPSTVSWFRADDLFSFDWQIAIGDHILGKREFEQLVQGASGVLRIKDEYVYLDPKELASLSAALAAPPKVTAPELLRIAIAGELDGAAIARDKNAEAILRKLQDIEPCSLPDGLEAQLRPYQERGFNWLFRNACIGFGSVIADDMGLGKTLQVIAAILALKQVGALDAAKA